ncbi:MAG: 50S ribosomal protein L9 [Sporolactobacillus sp.]
MKVIFIQNVKGKAQLGEIKDVSEGYARNYLFPQQIAVVASKENVGRLQAEKKRHKRQQAEELEEAKALKEKIEQLTLELAAKSGEGGRLFGSITSKQIADELKKRQLVIDKRKIDLDEPIRTLGYTDVSIRLHPQVTAAIKVHVTEV